MNGYFWANTIWYVLLAAASAAFYVAAFVKAENRRFFGAFTLAVIGLFYLFEFTLVALRAYDYFPMIFSWDRDMDTYIGNVFSQTSIACNHDVHHCLQAQMVLESDFRDRLFSCDGNL